MFRAQANLLRAVDHTSGSRTTFRRRNASYLRISPHAVLQLVLYLEPAHVPWMTDERLDRLLFALKERIPTKLAKEMEGIGRKGSKAREKTIVDVYRGSDYQIAFYFRSTSKKHVVLLKDKRLVTRPSSPPALSDSVHETEQSMARGRKRQRKAEALDLTRDKHDPNASEASTSAPQTHVKDEPLEDDDISALMVEPSQREQAIHDEEPEDKPDFDQKPLLKVDYRGYSIFNRSLVVVVEPYPPIDPAQLAAAAAPRSDEVRQLSATPRASSSATPAPSFSRGGGRDLFRSVTTPLDRDEDSGQDDRGASRETSAMLAKDLASDDSESLPALDDLLNRRTLQ